MSQVFVRLHDRLAAAAATPIWGCVSLWMVLGFVLVVLFGDPFQPPGMDGDGACTSVMWSSPMVGACLAG